MNPDTNQFQELKDDEEKEDFIRRFYGRQEEAGEQLPIFELGEDIEIKGYIFKVLQIRKNRMLLRPIGLPYRKSKLKEKLEELAEKKSTTPGTNLFDQKENLKNVY